MAEDTASASLYEQFRASYGRDGPDYSILKKADGAEREALIEALIQAVNTNKDGWAALALGTLKAAAAVPALTVALEAAAPSEGAYLARALWDIEGRIEHVVYIAEAIFEPGNDPFDRMSLIGLLTRVREPPAFDALERALYDRDYLVRRCAASIFSHNSARRTADRTIDNNLSNYDEQKIRRFAEKLRSKIDPR